MILILYMLKTYTTTTQFILSFSQIFILNFSIDWILYFFVLFFPFYLLIQKFFAGYNQNT